jgi:DNA-binding NarL/FixJ family response regulator
MSKGPIRLFLVDPLLSVRVAIAFMLERESDLTVVGHVGSLADVRHCLDTLTERVDIALVTLQLPDGAGPDVLSVLRARFPACQAIALTAIDDRRVHAHAIAAGIAGALHKSCSIEEIVGAIRRLARGESIHPPDEMIAMLRLATQHQAAEVAARAALQRLTQRERQILQALAQGLSDKEIARRLQVSTNTVAAHMVNLLGKLGVDSRLQAVILAIKHQAVTLDES